MYLHSLSPIAFLIYLFPPRQLIVEQQGPNPKTLSTLRNTQLLVVKGPSSFKVSKFGTLFPQTLETYHLTNSRLV